MDLSTRKRLKTCPACNGSLCVDSISQECHSYDVVEGVVTYRARSSSKNYKVVYCTRCSFRTNTEGEVEFPTRLRNSIVTIEGDRIYMNSF